MLWLMAGFAAAFSAGAAGVRVENLRCEYLSDRFSLPQPAG
jgi:hypothetical protein